MEVSSLPVYVWNHVVEYLPRSDLHNCILVSKKSFDVIHEAGPAGWRSLAIKPTSVTIDQFIPNLHSRRYRCVTSLTIKGIWTGEFLAGVLKLVNRDIRELDLDSPPSDWTTEGACELLRQIGPSLRKLVLGYSFFSAEPALPTIIAENCPRIVHLEMRSPPLSYGVNQQFPIPPSLSTLCPNIHTLGWVCYPLATKFDLSPISGMRKLHTLYLSNLSVLDNPSFATHVINAGLPLVTLELTLPYTFQHQGLCSFAPLASTLRTLRLYNCSYNLRSLQLNLLPNLRTVVYYTSLRECDFETVDILTSLPLETLEIRFQSSLRSIQLRERFVQLMSKKPYRLVTRGTLYDTFCYTICS